MVIKRLIIKQDIVALRLISVFIFYICMNITYLSSLFHISVQLTLVMRAICIAWLFLLNLKKNHGYRCSKNFLLITAWFITVVLSTLVNSGDVVNATNILSRAYMICVFIDYYGSNKKKLIVILETWEFILLILCLLDIASIILYPNGLYVGEMYEVVWFLGYKTARLVYTIPLALLACFLPYLKKGHVTLSSYIIVVLCILGAFLSSAIASGTALLVYLVLILFGTFGKNSRIINNMRYTIFNYKTIFVGYSILFILVVVVQSNSFILLLVQNIFGKSDTISHRTDIWANCLGYFFGNPILGLGYLTTDEYVSNITYYSLGTSAHNMMLSILLTSGIVGFVVYALMFSRSLKRKNKIYTYSELLVVFNIIAMLVVGLTSSTLIFSVFSYLPYLLLGYGLDAENKIGHDTNRLLWRKRT